MEKIFQRQAQLQLFSEPFQEPEIFWNTQFQHGKMATYNGVKTRDYF